MAIRVLPLTLLVALTGCVFPAPYLDRGNECGPIPQSTTAQCYNRVPMTKAEYHTARNKLRAQDSKTEDQGEEGQIEEIVPLGAQYKIGTP